MVISSDPEEEAEEYLPYIPPIPKTVATYHLLTPKRYQELISLESDWIELHAKLQEIHLGWTNARNEWIAHSICEELMRFMEEKRPTTHVSGT